MFVNMARFGLQYRISPLSVCNNDFRPVNKPPQAPFYGVLCRLNWADDHRPRPRPRLDPGESGDSAASSSSLLSVAGRFSLRLG